MDKIRKRIAGSSTLFIRPSLSADEPVEWLFRLNKETVTSGTLANMAETGKLKEYTAGGEVVLIIPGELAVFHAVEIPGAGRVKMSSKLLKALPYWLDGKVAGEVESLEWVLVAAGAPCTLLGVAKNLLQQWVNFFISAEMPLHRIVPETLCLPVPAKGEWSCLYDRQRWLVRQGEGSGMVIDGQWLHALPELAENGAVGRVYGDCDGAVIPHGWQQMAPGKALEILVAHSSSHPANLLTKPVGIKGRRKPGDYKSVLLLGVTASVGLCMASFLNGYHQHRVAEEMEMRSQQLYQQLTNSKKKVSNPKFRLTQLIKKTAAQDNQSNPIALLNALAEASETAEGIVIHTIHYDGETGTLYLATRRKDAATLTTSLAALSIKVSEGAPDAVENNQLETAWLQMKTQ